MDYKIPLSLLQYDQLSSQENYEYKFKQYTDEELDAIEIKNLPKYDIKKMFKDQSKVIEEMQYALKKTTEINDLLAQRKSTSSSKRQLLGPKVFEFQDPDTKSKLVTPTTANTPNIGVSQSQKTPINVSAQILVQNQEEQDINQIQSGLHSQQVKNQIGNQNDELEQYASILQDIDLKDLEELCSQDQSKYLLSQMDQAKEAIDNAFKRVVDWSEQQFNDASIISKEEMENIDRKVEIKKQLNEIVMQLENDIKLQDQVNNIIKTHIKEDEKSLRIIFPDFNSESEENYDLSDQSIILGQDTKEKIGELQQKLPKQYAKQDEQLENFTTPERRSFVYQMKQKEQEEYNQLIEQQLKQRLSEQQKVIDSLENNNQPLLLRKSLLEQQMEGQESNIKSIQRDDRDNDNVIDVREKMQGNDKKGQLEKNKALQELINREEQLLLLLKDLTGILIEYDEETRIYTLRSKKDDSRYMTYQAEVGFKHILLITNETRLRIPCTSHQKVKEYICSYFCK